VALGGLHSSFLPNLNHELLAFEEALHLSKRKRCRKRCQAFNQLILYSTGPGEFYWTTAAKTILPKGKHLDLEVKHDGGRHEHKLIIDEPKTLHGLRLVPCAGEVKLEGLALKSMSGDVLAKRP
jgi:hypothetical protein